MAHSTEESRRAKRNGRKGGRPEIKFNESVAGAIEIMAYSGRTQQEMADQLDMSTKTLRKLYSENIKNGKVKMANALMKVDLTVALDPNAKDSAKCRHFQLERVVGLTRSQSVVVKHESIADRLRKARQRRLGAAAIEAVIDDEEE